jgi:hypothetical protein
MGWHLCPWCRSHPDSRASRPVPTDFVVLGDGEDTSTRTEALDASPLPPPAVATPVAVKPMPAPRRRPDDPPPRVGGTTTATDRLQAAHENAQRRFHDMLESGVLRDPDDPFVCRYVQSERAVDRILLELQGETLAAGDHFARPLPTAAR